MGQQIKQHWSLTLVIIVVLIGVIAFTILAVWRLGWHWEGFASLGSLALVVAALGGVVSLVYLAQQVKDNTKATQAATYQHLTEHITGITFAISKSEEFASFIQRVGGSDGGPEKPADRIRWASYAYSIFRNLDNLYYQCTIGTLDKDKRDELIKIAVEWNFKYYPQMRHYWRRYGHLFDQKFRGYVEEILTSLE